MEESKEIQQIENATQPRGLFITFEGPDGSGKSSVIKYVEENLIKDGYSVTLTREPGGVDIAEQIRSVILNPANTKMDKKTEALLYAAARSQHLEERIKPALKAGITVLCDRFIDSSLAYQGYGRDLGEKGIFEINKFATDGLMPDLTIFLDIPPKLGLERIAKRDKKDRLDNEPLQFHEKVYEGYLKIAEEHKNRIVKIDASKTKEEVCKAAYDVIKDLLSCD